MSIRGVNVGGSLFTVSDSTNVAPMELTGTATREYAKNRLLILSNGLLYKTNTVINNGDSIVAGSNVSPTSLDEELAVLGLTSNLIAPKEDGANSSDDYSVGDQIARSGLLYKVMATIEQGDTFVVGNNIELAGTVTEQINALKNASDNIVATMTENGAHNLLPNNIQSQVVNGVTITRNADGSLTFEKTGSVSATTLYLFNDSLNPIKLTSPCKLTSGAVNENTALIATVNGTDYACGTSTEEVSLPSGNMTRVRYYFNSSFTGTLTLKPMIRLATDSDTTYQPYAMTNRELTEQIDIISTHIDSSGFTITTDVGTLQGCDITLIKHSNRLPDVELAFFDLRISDLEVGELPIVKITHPKLSTFPSFLVSIPSGVRGPANSPVPTDGGYIQHGEGSNYAAYMNYNYIAAKPAGYLHTAK